MNKIVKNLLSSVLPQLINIISNLILPGMIIVAFGSEVNGLVSTTKNVISYISLVGAGIATSVTQALYAPVARDDNETVKGMLKSADNMFTRYGFLYLMITIVIALIYPYLMHSTIRYSVISLLLIVMSMSGASEFFAIGRCRALLYAHQKVYVCSLIQALSLALSLILALILLKLNAGIIMVQFGISFVYVLRGIFLTAYVRKVYPEYMDYRKCSPIDTAIQNRRNAMVHQLTGLVVTGSQAAILTALVGLEAASIYSVYNVVLYGIKMICSNLCTAITPFMGKKYALKQAKELKRMYNMIEFTITYFTAFVLSVTAVMLVPFVSLYTRGADIGYLFPVFGLLFVVSSMFYILKLPGTALINVAGHFRETCGRAFIEAGICVILSIVCTMAVGMDGVLIGTGCALGWRCIDTIFYINKNILNKTSIKSVVRLLIVLGNVIFAHIGTQWISWTPKNYNEWIVIAMVVSGVTIVSILIEMIIFDRKLFFEVIHGIHARIAQRANNTNK